MDFGKKSVWLVDEEGDKFSEEIHQRADIFKVGFNYFFGGPDPPAVSRPLAAYAKDGNVPPELQDDEQRARS